MHETDWCQSLKLLVEKLIKDWHLRRYVKEVDHKEESRQVVNRITARAAILSESRLAINYILSGPSDNHYQLKRQQKKLLSDAIVKARINAIHTKGIHEETNPIDGFISFPYVNPKRIIVPHYDVLVLTLCINGFDVHGVLVDSSNAKTLLQLPAFK